MLAIGGLVGFGCLLAFVLPIVRGAQRSIRQVRASGSESLVELTLVAWLSAVLVASCFDDVLYTNMPFTVLWAGVASVVLALPKAGGGSPNRPPSGSGDRAANSGGVTVLGSTEA